MQLDRIVQSSLPRVVRLTHVVKQTYLVERITLQPPRTLDRNIYLFIRNWRSPHATMLTLPSQTCQRLERENRKPRSSRYGSDSRVVNVASSPPGVNVSLSLKVIFGRHKSNRCALWYFLISSPWRMRSISSEQLVDVAESSSTFRRPNRGAVEDLILESFRNTPCK